MSLVLPNSVIYAEMARDIEERGATRRKHLLDLERELKDLDGCLSLVKATEKCKTVGMKPGYWHIKRDNPKTIPSYLPIEGPRGQFMEPHSGIIEELRRIDLQREGAMDELRKRQQAEQRSFEYDRALRKGERVDELATRIKAYDSPGVSRAARGRTARARQKAKR